MATKFYVVWNGRKTGVFNNWNDCKKQIDGFQGAQYMAFKTKNEAMDAFSKGAIMTKKQRKNNEIHSSLKQKEIREKEVNFNSIAVDAASSGNPGKMEYRGVLTQSGKQIFHQGVFEQGTSNIGEFLALVHGLALLKKKNSNKIIYSDSKIAINWVKKKKCNTKLTMSSKNEDLFKLIERAEAWLKANTFSTPIIKWETKRWGEIPADFGRK